MSTKPPNTEEGTELLNRKTEQIPQSWVDHGADEATREDETRFYATAVCHESLLHATRVSPTETDYSESGRLYVKYVDATGERAVERAYAAAIVDTGDDVDVIPKCVLQGDTHRFAATIAVADRETRVPVTDADREMLVARHGVSL